MSIRNNIRSQIMSNISELTVTGVMKPEEVRVIGRVYNEEVSKILQELKDGLTIMVPQSYPLEECNTVVQHLLKAAIDKTGGDIIEGADLVSSCRLVGGSSKESFRYHLMHLARALDEKTWWGRLVNGNKNPHTEMVEDLFEMINNQDEN